MNDKIKLIINLNRGVLKAFVTLTIKEDKCIKLQELIDKVDVLDTANSSTLKKMLNDENFITLINLFALGVLAEEDGL